MIEAFRKLVEERGRGLRSKSRAELLDLQDCPTERVEIDGQAGTIDLIVEEEPAGSLRVVVQGFLDTKRFPRLGFKNVALYGFRMDSDDTLSALRDEEFYEFD
ncbi:MAG TPA: hypothetical protein VK468_02835 [Pyrinomonadaceae bacterium]|nr:hypothetical protein [Pyrinomonadaceae bacterium]